MVLVSHKFKFIYIKNYKVASTSVESFFSRFCINPDNNYFYKKNNNQYKDNYGIIGSRGYNAQMGNKWYNHMNALSIRNNLGFNKFYKYIKFCVVRNPYDVLVSSYFFRKIKIPFKQYAKTTIINNLARYSINKQCICDYYIRFEHLEEDIVEMCNVLNITNYNINDLPYYKSNSRDKSISYRQYYDEKTRRIVYQNHKKEIDLFGYTF